MHQLERKLDNIVLGGLKLYVNIPKFGRDAVEKIIPKAKRMEHDEQNENEAPRRRQPYPRMNPGSYAEAVVRNNRSSSQRRTSYNENHSREG